MNLSRLEQIALLIALMALPFTTMSAQFDIHGPSGSGAFGKSVGTRSNGLIVVSDPEYDAPGPIVDVGAVYLYDQQGNMISMLTGSSPGDKVGTGVIAYADYLLVTSPDWDNGSAADAGAVTFMDGSSGLSGTVSPLNSIVGSSTNDRVGSIVRYAPSPMDYMVIVLGWDDGAVADVGAVRWGNGSNFPVGPISASNALIGDTTGDFGLFLITQQLANDNLVLSFHSWDNGNAVDAGAVTWIDRNNPATGVISSANSLVGSSAYDRVGSVRPLANGNYIVNASDWDNGSVSNAGASVWANGTTGIVGTISPSNAMVGTSTNDKVADYSIALSNGNYIVMSQNWRNGSAQRAGAVTWCNGVAGCTGTISAANSLVGTQTDDLIGMNTQELANGNFVTSSSTWGGGRGAATWGNGSTGISGQVSVGNSLVGNSTSDLVSRVVPLSNGNYVVASPYWGATDQGAITWADGTTGKVGLVTSANSVVGSGAGELLGLHVSALRGSSDYIVVNPNWDNGSTLDVGAVKQFDGTQEATGTFSGVNALIGSTAGDRVGDCVLNCYTRILDNGNYVIFSSEWDNGAAADAGAVTWMNAAAPTTGPVSSLNSLVGSSAGDRIGTADGMFGYISADYTVVPSQFWDNGSIADVGAITVFDGQPGSFGPVSASNSLVGTTADDNVGFASTIPGPNITISYPRIDRIVAFSSRWDNGPIVDAGAITVGVIGESTTGPINSGNSVLGTVAGAGIRMVHSYDAIRDQLVVGRPDSNIVTIFNFLVFANGFE
jgi:hypothetical protein